MAEEQRAPAVLRAWRWIWQPSERKLHVDTCPRCSETIVMPAVKVEQSPLKKTFALPAPPDEGQRLAACAEHGWAPYNERSRQLHGRRGAG